MKYHKQKDGEWVEPQFGYKMQCCDCGLIHKIDFRVRNGKIQFRAFRDNRATGQIKRHFHDLSEPSFKIRSLETIIHHKNMSLKKVCHKLNSLKAERFMKLIEKSEG